MSCMDLDWIFSLDNFGTIVAHAPMQTCPLAPAISLLLAARRGSLGCELGLRAWAHLIRISLPLHLVPICLVDVAAPKRHGVQDGALCETACSLMMSVVAQYQSRARSAFALV
ncbi:hypothetical protein ARSEF4850_003632 [Beauveria asiatica]